DELKLTISEALTIKEDLITSIDPLGGLTNRNYKMVIDNNEYAVRLPGKGTEKYLNRPSERMISEKASNLGINPKVLYCDENSGLKIVEYILNAETLNAKTAKREDNLIKVADILRRLHSSGEDFKEQFDVFEKIKEYEGILANANGTLIQGYQDVKKQIIE